MSEILNWLKCDNCENTLSLPVSLPCGHTICKEHTETTDEQILCVQCNVYHANKGFSVNKKFSQIASQLTSISFGPEHKNAKKSCETLRDLVTQIDLLIRDPKFYTHEEISVLKNRVHLKSEQIKEEVERRTQKLLDQLEEYEKNCDQILKSSDHESNCKSMQLVKDISHTELEKVSSVLNELKFDETEWKKIQLESDKRSEDLRQKLNVFKNSLLLNDYEQKKQEVEIFEKIR